MPKNNVTRKDVDVNNYFYKDAQPNLRTYFGRVVKGQPEVYDTPFARGESTEELLQAWNVVLKSIDGTWPTLYEFEKDMATKVGPLSIMKPLSERMEDIEAYYTGILLPAKPILETAIKATVSEWNAARGLRLRNQILTVSRMKKSTNSGSPFFTKRKLVVGSTLPVQTYQNGDVTDTIQQGNLMSACAVLGWRGQEGGMSEEDVKQRVVWMFPFGVNIRELQCYQPLIEAAQKNLIVPAWVSNEQVDKVVTQLFDTKGKNDLIVCTDFSKFDQHFNPVMQQAAREVLSAILAPGVFSRDWLDDVFPIKYRIQLMYNFGEITTGLHGMGSGSGGTNADETLAHRALQYEAAILNRSRLNPNSQCLGDDGMLSYPGITVGDVVEAYQSHGLEMNESKQYASTQDCIYLRRWHHTDYRVNGICAGVYSTNRALGRLRYLERFMSPEIWGPKMVALRQLSILENVKNHPLREQFAQFCMKRDKYRLGIDIPGFLDHLEQEARIAIDYMPDFLGYTKTLQSEGKDIAEGINQWWIVKYLKEFK